jgi:hypothetical protein
VSLELAKVSIKVEADTSGIKDDFDKAERIAKEAGQDAAKKFNEGIEKAGGDIDVNGKVKVRGGRGRGGRGGGIGGLTVGMTAAAASVGKAAPVIGGALGGIGLGLGAAAAGAGVFLGKAYQAADATMSLEAGLMNVRKQMGFTGKGFKGTTERLDNFARSAAEATGVQQDMVLTAQTTLATFGNIGKTMKKDGGMFDRATLASMDLAAANFGSVEGNAVQLGKALNDPITGLSALGEAGVTFSESEKEVIKGLVESGNLLKAQDILLKAIETQVGGTAKATASATDQLSASWGMVASDIGRDLLPTFDDVFNTLRTDGIPAFKELYDTLAPDIKNGLKGAVEWLTTDGLDKMKNFVDWMKTDGVVWLDRMWGALENVANFAISAANNVAIANNILDQIDAEDKEARGGGEGGTSKFYDKWIKGAFSNADEIPALAMIAADSLPRAIDKKIDKGLTTKNVLTPLIADWNNEFVKAGSRYGRVTNPDRKGTPDHLGGTSKATRDLLEKNGIRPDYKKTIPAMAKGGYVTSPTLALVGEAGPEYVLPEKKLQSMGGVSIVVNVAGDADAPKVKRIVEQTLDETLQSGALALVAGGM